MAIGLPVVISSGVIVPAARNLIAPDELANVNGVMDAYLAPTGAPPSRPTSRASRTV